MNTIQVTKLEKQVLEVLEQLQFNQIKKSLLEDTFCQSQSF